MSNEALDPQAADLQKLRHSLAHVLAQAVLELRPGSKLGFGPAIEDGFYYDFILSEPISDADFTAIEKKMRHIIKQTQKFEREDVEAEAALTRIEGMGEPYKKEYARELIGSKGLKSLSFYKNGPFLDMCEGPHVDHTGKLPEQGFKLRTVAGAYWRGDSRNVQMTRIYAWAFATREELDKHVNEWKMAQERDHKKLGKELELFVIDDQIGAGLPLWLPKGTVVRDELEKLAKELEFKYGYDRVSTPHLAKADLYYKTGHLPYYAVHMYPMMEVADKKAKEEAPAAPPRPGDGIHGEDPDTKEVYCLKPMNCPHHHRIFASRRRSYRELPLRLAEYGTCYRFEDSGALSGLLRVRSLSMNDAHIYCTIDQVKQELLSVMALQREVYGILGLSDFHFRFSTWDKDDPKGTQKYVNDPESWVQTQDMVREALIDLGAPYKEVKGEAAFYGPKIDVQFRTVTGREETASTNQLDFAVPGRLGLEYNGADNKNHTPYVIHRAPLGTHERFVAFLIEHYGGAFPAWLAPVQVRIITVSEKFDDYAKKLSADLRQNMVRAELDDSDERINKKIMNGATQKIPNLIILGEREEADQTVTLRRYGVKEQETMPYEAFKARLLKTISGRMPKFADA